MVVVSAMGVHNVLALVAKAGAALLLMVMLMVAGCGGGSGLPSDVDGLDASIAGPEQGMGPVTSDGGSGDACSGLEVFLTLHDFGSTLEASIQFHNPGPASWQGELNLDYVHTSEPSTRHVVLQNVDAEIGPGSWHILDVLLLTPDVPGVYEFRAFGINGIAVRSFEVDSATRP